MILGAICIFLGHLLNVNSAEDPAQYVRDISAHHAAFIAGSVIVSAGAFLVIAAMVGAMRLASGRGGTLVTIGAVLSCISAASLGAGTLMLGLVMAMLTPAHAALALQVDRIGMHSSIGSLPFTLAPGLVIGLGIEVWRSSRPDNQALPVSQREAYPAQAGPRACPGARSEQVIDGQ